MPRVLKFSEKHEIETAGITFCKMGLGVMGFKCLGVFLFLCAWGQAEERSFLVFSFAGDTMLGTAQSPTLPSENLILPVSKIFKSSDISFLNYEGTLCDLPLKSHKCQNKSAGELCYAFRGPTKLASYIAEAGVKIVSLANNHIFDYGHQCANDTKSAFEKVGVATVGLMSQEKMQPGETIRFLKHKDKNILFFGFHYSDAWGRVISMSDEANVRGLIRQYRDQADIIVVSVHQGGEGPDLNRTPLGIEKYSGENSGNSRQFAHIAIDEGADLIVGSGPHVVRGLEMYKERLIIYSLGNFATYDLFSLTPTFNVGAMLEVGLDEEGRLQKGKIHSIKQDYIKPGQKRAGIYVKFDEQQTAASLIEKVSTLDFATPPKILKDGSFTP